jgi:hypothetical protein
MKDIPGYEGIYAITDDGKVYAYPKINSYLNGLWRKITTNAQGQLRVIFSNNGKRKWHFISRLVALTYIGPPPPDKPHVFHKNGIVTDNRVGNLEYRNSLEINTETWEKGLTKFSEETRKISSEYSRSKRNITQQDADNLKEDRKNGYGMILLSEKYGIPLWSVHSIIHGRTYKS